MAKFIVPVWIENHCGKLISLITYWNLCLRYLLLLLERIKGLCMHAYVVTYLRMYWSEYAYAHTHTHTHTHTHIAIATELVF